ncbi:AraC family transcriptional regulator [Streptomyces sp. YIM 98790]|uniref:helix-turn-helix transcriptional regulator n=1 Tax=Streptomyces sp. YIM 98790 TaxID=2689077 RepID=UPI00140A8BE4|nr:AraC family transcriptional regulator [Streptomyces sp. YIM 98790]
MRERAEWTRLAMGTGHRPLDLMAARFHEHRYAPHAHEEFAVGVTLGGLEVIDYRGGRLYSGPGSIVVLEPGEVHTGGPAGDDGFAYRVAYPPEALLAEGVAGGRPPRFRRPVIEDPPLAAALHRAYREAAGAGTAAAAAGTADALEHESRLLGLFAELARRHAAPGTARPPREIADPAGHLVRHVRERLAAGLLAPPSLADLAAELGVSRYQLLRAFRRGSGMPPYAWLAQYRVDRARVLLAAGHRPAEAAALTGFADQAHLTRWFRRVLGVTPAAYRNSVQDAARRTPAS